MFSGTDSLFCSEYYQVLIAIHLPTPGRLNRNRKYTEISSISVSTISGMSNDITSVLLADSTAIQYDRLLASSVRPSVCLSVTLCIVALGVGVHG